MIFLFTLCTQDCAVSNYHKWPETNNNREVTIGKSLTREKNDVAEQLCSHDILLVTLRFSSITYEESGARIRYELRD